MIQMNLELDDIDYATIQREITFRQAQSRLIDPAGPTLLPDSDSNFAGNILAEVCRDLREYRTLYNTGSITGQ